MHCVGGLTGESSLNDVLVWRASGPSLSVHIVHLVAALFSRVIDRVTDCHYESLYANLVFRNRCH